MNKQLYKLVFSKHLGMLVPASEAAAGHRCKGTDSRVRNQRRALAAAALISVQSINVAYALDVNALPTGGNIRSGAGSINTVGNRMNINSSTNKMVVNWNSFNVGARAGVNFNMPSRTSSVLNRVIGNSKSEIYGQINANGHVYLVNSNGIYFGSGAQINVGSLTATTLDNLSNDDIVNRYNDGILPTDANTPSFSFAGAVGVIDVADGANITTTSGGRVMLLAPDVNNSGVITTPDGQTILAAGKTIYLTKQDDFAGLMVEVNSGGNATNLGQIVADHGNVSLVGMAVNQQGRISASTSVRANGSIYLTAKEIPLKSTGNKVATFGNVTLGKNSSTTIAVDVDDTEKVIDSQTVAKSLVDITGRVVDIEGSIVAKSGDVKVTGSERVFLGSTASIDVSGVDAVAPMSRNQLAIQLFSDQLRDSPILRGGALFGETLYLDARKGTDIISDEVIAEAKKGIGRTVAERMTGGGTVNLNGGAGSVITQAGSTINVSGGQTTYTGGNIKESRLLYNGKWVLASDAKANTPYQGINDKYSKTYSKWGETRSWQMTSAENGRFQQGYLVGSDAGSISVSALGAAVLNGDMIAKTVAGRYQRGAEGDMALAKGGALNLSVANLRIVDTPSNLPLTFKFDDILPSEYAQETQLDTDVLAQGFNRLSLVSTGAINVDANMRGAADGTLLLDGGAGVNVNSNISFASGDITLAASDTSNVKIADKVEVSTAGLFTNDTPGVAGAMLAPIAIDGGSITVNDGLLLGQGASLNASAGAWINNKKVLSGGHGGNITVTLADNQVQAGQFLSYGFKQGGELTISTPSLGSAILQDIQIGGITPNQQNTLWLSEGFFTEGGFSKYTLKAPTLDGDILVGDAANSVVNISPQMQNLEAKAGVRALVSGTEMTKVADAVTLAKHLRAPVSINLDAGDDLTVASNATIRTEAPISRTGAQGDISLTSQGQLTVLGDLIAPAADISIAIRTNIASRGLEQPNGSFDDTLSLYIGENAHISAIGQYIAPPAADGNLRKAEVLDAGTISLSTSLPVNNMEGPYNGVIVVKQGAVLDVSATSGNVDVLVDKSYNRELVDGAAGTISIAARDGLALDGSLRANASGVGAGGTLNITLGGQREGRSGVEQGYTNGLRRLTVTQNLETLADGIVAGGSMASLINQPRTLTGEPDFAQEATGVGNVSAEQIKEGGFDNVSLKAGIQTENNEIVFGTGLSLNVPSSLTLDASAFVGGANISASNLTLTNTTGLTLSTPVLGTAALNFSANFIDIAGNVAITNVASTTLKSSQDIRGRGIAQQAGLGESKLLATKEINLDARQIYPATANTFTVTATGDDSRIKISNSSGQTSSVPYSAAGVLTLNADNIEQGGTLRAPLGQINLNASDSLSFTKGSLTSISAEGSLIPYAITFLGGTNLGNSESISEESALIAKKINLNADNIDMQSGATIDISGGGDTFAYEWIEGIGGSTDFLAKTGVYAVLPSLQASYAPHDVLYNKTSDVKLGDAIYLSGGNGLAAGTYTLLPARYALLPGAYLVQTSGASVKKDGNLQQLDGASLVSGYLTKLDNSSRGQYTSFKVTNGSVFTENYGTKDYKGPADYLLTKGNSFFTNKAINDNVSTPRLASDAGQLTIAADASLNLDAEVLTNKAAGARGALVDISSNSIKVVSTVGAPQAGVLQVKASSLNNLKAESLLLGGTRTIDGDTQTVTATAAQIEVANDANNALSTNELILASSDKITLNTGAVVGTAANANSSGAGNTVLKTTGDGALVAVSAVNNIDYSRTGSSASPSTGTLEIQSGATLTAQRSMVLDATKKTEQSGTVRVADKGSLTLGADTILIGDSGSADGTKVDAATLASFGNLSAVALNSYKNIDIYGATSFGSGNVNLTFNAGGVVHHGTGDAVITAQTFTLKNSSGTFAAPNDAGTANLTVNANNIVFSDVATGKTNEIAGFDNVNLNAAEEVRFSGAATLNVAATQTNINSARITADTGANYTLEATGKLNTASNGTQLSSVSKGLGAKLNLESSETTLAGNIELLSGQFKASSSAGDLVVANGANIATRSAKVVFDENYSAYTDAGNITLSSTTNDVKVNAGALLDVSGGDAAGDAGQLNVVAEKGSFTVADGTLKGSAASGEKTASLNLDVKTLSNFSEVNRALETGKFNESRDIRVRTGNVAIAQADTVTAHNFVMGVDAGNVEIAGKVNADGQQGGNIEIYASGNVTLKSTGQLLARGTQANTSSGDLEKGAGGEVLLSSSSKASVNAVSAETGALIDVSGYSAAANNNVGVNGAKGEVTLRGYRGTTTTPTNTVNVAFNTTAAIKGAETVRVEGVRVYESNTFNASTPSVIAETNDFYNANSTQGSYANTQDGAAIKVLPNIEVRSSSGSDLAVGATAVTGGTVADLNLRALGALQAGKGGTLNLRAARNLVVRGGLSDGFDANGDIKANSAAATLVSAETFDYQMVAGADYEAANTKTTVKDKGNFSLANDKIIRTGTGDISIAAGGNMTMGNDSSVIYTVGKAADLLAGFDAPALATFTVVKTTGAVTGTTNGVTAASYLTQGGDINIDVQGNITGAASTQSVNQWLLRQGGGTGNKDVSWWVRPDLFKQGVAALGGGNVKVSAGGNITNFSASSATTARYDSNSTNFDLITGERIVNTIVNGGGDVDVSAGGNITNGLYYAGRGNISLNAGASILKTGTTGTLIALQDASADVSAANSVKIETVFNPTIWAQTLTAVNESDGSNSFFLTYGNNSAFDVSALTGDVEIGLSNAANIGGRTSLSGTNTAAANGGALSVHPGTVAVASFSGDVKLNELTLAPTTKGNLSVLAAKNISTNAQLVTISDADLSNTLSLASPATNMTSGVLTDTLRTIVSESAPSPIHTNDSTRVAIVASQGDVTIKQVPVGRADKIIVGLKSSKAAYISAGDDISMTASIQHANSNDVSVIRAGNDIVMPVDKTTASIEVSGPGELLVEAGRNIDLGNSTGILSLANTENPALASSGASITMVAGLGEAGSDVAGFVASYINPTGSGPSSLQGDAKKLAEYRSNTSQSVASYMRKLTANSALSEAEAMTQFLALDQDKQAVFAYRHFGAELLAAGKEFVASASTTRGDNAINSLFSGGGYDGDILMFQSQVRTARDASIDMLAPGGLINAGVAADVSSLLHDIGIVTEKGGAIRAFADSGFQVNKSKVITQFGSDITVWVNNGDIDAGRGSKTALSVPERVVSVDADGNVAVELKGVAAGSGIRAQTYDPDGENGSQVAPKLGTVALFAPRGVLNASEAGIASGDFIAGALQVIGTNNIDISGSSSGVAAVDTGSLAGSLAGVADTATAATNAMSENLVNQPASQPFSAKDLPAIVTVKTIRLED